jgi:hypothetical protein
VMTAGAACASALLAQHALRSTTVTRARHDDRFMAILFGTRYWVSIVQSETAVGCSRNSDLL